MYYRRKILLSLIERNNNILEKLRLQKLLFLLAESQDEPSFHFIPYKYGCFSFQANADLTTMIKYGLVEETETSWKKKDDYCYFEKIKSSDRKIIDDVLEKFQSFSTNKLIRYTYENYPYYALRSIKAKELLQPSEYRKIIKSVKSDQEQALFTIGYEGLKVEEYFNKLVNENIKALVDVRKNPLSMKYGFSKKQLKLICSALDIKYIHIPGLGIDSSKRKQLETQADYDKLFEEYKSSSLKNNLDEQIELLECFVKYKRIALTCFEKNIDQCHRKHLALNLIKVAGKEIKITHIQGSRNGKQKSNNYS